MRPKSAKADPFFKKNFNVMQNFYCKTYTTLVITQCVAAVYQNEIINLRHRERSNRSTLPKGGIQ